MDDLHPTLEEALMYGSYVSRYRSLVFRFLAAPAMSLALATLASAQENYPTKPITIIVPLTPGASVDLSARMTGGFLSKKFGVPVNVVNKPGGATVPGGLEVYRAAPDGYTLLQDGNATSTLLMVSRKNLPFDVMKRTWIGMTSGTEMLIIVPSSSSLKTLAEVGAEAKRNPDSFTWSSVGGGTGAVEVVIRQFFKTIGVDVNKTKAVIAQGGAGAVALTAGGHVKLGGGSTTGALSPYRSNLVTPLGITRQRSADFPGVPTFAEQGYPSINYWNWLALSGPPNMPEHVVATLASALKEMTEDPQFIANSRKIGLQPFYADAKQTLDYVAKEMVEMQELFSSK